MRVASLGGDKRVGGWPTYKAPVRQYTGSAMERESPFRILSRREFDGLSLEEKLAYLDLELTQLYGDAWQQRRGRPSRTDEPLESEKVVEKIVH